MPRAGGRHISVMNWLSSSRSRLRRSSVDLVPPFVASLASRGQMNSSAFLEKAARHYPDHPAVVHGKASITYSEFRDRALAIGGNLRALGCDTRDRGAFCLANGPQILDLIFRCFAAGLVVVPINARLHTREIGYIVQNSLARVLVYGPEYHEGIEVNSASFAGLERRVCTTFVQGALDYTALLNPASSLAAGVDAEAEDFCWLFYTSGTTGRPKGAIWNHRMVRAVVMNYLADIYNIQSSDVVLHAAPM